MSLPSGFLPAELVCWSYGQKKSKLDDGVSTHEDVLRFEGKKNVVESRGCSDHKPIFVGVGEETLV